MAVGMLQHGPDFLEAYLNKQLYLDVDSHPQIKVSIFYPDIFYFSVGLDGWISLPE